METMTLSIGNPLVMNGFMIYKSYTYSVDEHPLIILVSKGCCLIGLWI